MFPSPLEVDRYLYIVRASDINQKMVLTVFPSSLEVDRYLYNHYGKFYQLSLDRFRPLSR